MKRHQNPSETGTASWDKSAGDHGEVRVSPRLIRASDETQLWSERYEREIESIFDVQSEIAEEVIKQLDLTLLAPERRELQVRPTDNLEAYDFYLRGMDHKKKGTLRIDPQEWNLAVEMFEKAIELDPNFVPAHVALSNAHSEIFFNGFDKTEERLTLSRKAVDKALELQPDSPEAKRALALYYYRGFRDYERALELFESVQKARPNSSPAQIAWIQRRQGKHQECLETLKKAIQLDPRSPDLAKGLANTYSWLRRYEEADRWFDITLSLSPDDFRTMIWKMMNSFHRTGNYQEARSLLQKFPPIPIADFAWIMVEMEDRNYEHVLEMLSSFPFEEVELQDSYYNKDLMYAKAYNALNKPSRMESYAQSARTTLEKRTVEHPEDVRYHVSLSQAYSLLGQKDEALREIHQAVKLVPVSLDAFAGPGYVLSLAEILIIVGEYDEAMDKLEYLMSIPAGQFVSIFSLRNRSIFDPLRNHPRFVRLLEKYSN
jgi:tetratricopeptide (TPR) repeat protein